MSVKKISVLAAAVLWWCSAVAQEPNVTRVEQRFAQHTAANSDCSASLRWGENCPQTNVLAPQPSSLSVTAATSPRALTRQAFPEKSPALLTRFIQE